MNAPCQPRAYIVTESESRYSLLGAFGRQFGVAMARCGVEVNPDAGGPVSWEKFGAHGRAAYVFFNHMASVEEAYGWAGNLDRGSERAIVQWCVDHPLTIDAGWLDRMSRDPGFRLLTVTSDDASLLSLRFPNLRQATVWHGVDESALCEVGGIEESHGGNGKRHHAEHGGTQTQTQRRDIDVVIAGSIASVREIEGYRARVPGVLHKVCDEIVALRLAHPAMAFGQAMEIALPSGMKASDHWAMMAAIFAYTTAVVGRERRVAVARAMQGLNCVVIGTEAWKEFAIGSLSYGGQVGYEELPGWLRRAKVCVAVSPPQFATGFSERVLLSMAAGCATVAEERVGITREFVTGIKMPVPPAPPLVQYPANCAEAGREIVERLLSRAEERVAMGVAGRGVVEAGHLWLHRVGQVMEVAGMAESGAPAHRAAA